MRIAKPFTLITLIAVGALLAVLTGLLALAVASGRVESQTATDAPISASPPIPTVAPIEIAAALPTSTSTSTVAPPPTATQPAAVTPTLTITVTATLRTPTPRPTAAQPDEWQRIQIPEIRLAFEVPADWLQWRDDEWSWVGSSGGLVGVTWGSVETGWEPAALLPAGARILQTSSVGLGWTEGTAFTVQLVVDNTAIAVEKHIIFRPEAQLAVDIYVSGRNTPELVALQPVLDRLLNSVTLSSNLDDPIDVAVQYLGTVLRGGTGVEFLSTNLRDRASLDLLGVQQLYSSFYVNLIGSDGKGGVLVRAELTFPEGRVATRTITLIDQDGDWRIDAIAP